MVVTVGMTWWALCAFGCSRTVPGAQGGCPDPPPLLGVPCDPLEVTSRCAYPGTDPACPAAPSTVRRCDPIRRQWSLPEPDACSTPDVPPDVPAPSPDVPPPSDLPTLSDLPALSDVPTLSDVPGAPADPRCPADLSAAQTPCPATVEPITCRYGPPGCSQESWALVCAPGATRWRQRPTLCDPDPVCPDAAPDEYTPCTPPAGRTRCVYGNRSECSVETRHYFCHTSGVWAHDVHPCNPPVDCLPYLPWDGTMCDLLSPGRVCEYGDCEGRPLARVTCDERHSWAVTFLACSLDAGTLNRREIRLRPYLPPDAGVDAAVARDAATDGAIDP